MFSGYPHRPIQVNKCNENVANEILLFPLACEASVPVQRAFRILVARKLEREQSHQFTSYAPECGKALRTGTLAKQASFHC